LKTFYETINLGTYMVHLASFCDDGFVTIRWVWFALPASGENRPAGSTDQRANRTASKIPDVLSADLIFIEDTDNM
jgi:hypothetical protein